MAPYDRDEDMENENLLILAEAAEFVEPDNLALLANVVADIDLYDDLANLLVLADAAESLEPDNLALLANVAADIDIVPHQDNDGNQSPPQSPTQDIYIPVVDPLVDYENSPRVHPTYLFNLSRDHALLLEGELREGVPAFRDWDDRENWIRCQLLKHDDVQRLKHVASVERELKERADIIHMFVPALTEEQERQRKFDEWARDDERIAESSGDDSGIAEDGIPFEIGRPVPDVFEDEPDELYPTYTFQPIDPENPTRPGEFVRHLYDHANLDANEQAAAIRQGPYVVMVGEINPSYEHEKGDIMVMHPATGRIGRKYPTGFIRVITQESDFQQYGVQHGDLVLKIGEVLTCRGQFAARPDGRVIFEPLLGLLLHSFVDLDARANIHIQGMRCKYLGKQHELQAIYPWELVNDRQFRNMKLGTNCTNLFKISVGDILILPQAWQDNYSHKYNFRRSMVKWYRGPQSDHRIVNGTMVVRSCADRGTSRSAASHVYGNHPTDQGYNWGYVELFYRDEGQWTFWGRDKMFPTRSLPPVGAPTILYTSDA